MYHNATIRESQLSHFFVVFFRLLYHNHGLAQSSTYLPIFMGNVWINSLHNSWDRLWYQANHYLIIRNEIGFLNNFVYLTFLLVFFCIDLLPVIPIIIVCFLIETKLWVCLLIRTGLVSWNWNVKFTNWTRKLKQGKEQKDISGKKETQND